MMKLLILLLGIAATACSPQAVVQSNLETVASNVKHSQNSHYIVQINPDIKQVEFVGQLPLLSSQENTGNMMYSGANAGVFLASIVTHAATSSSVQSAQERKRIEEANKVLIPYKSAIARINYQKSLNAAALEIANTTSFNTFTTPKAKGHQLSLIMSPQFIMTHSKDAIYLKTVVTIKSAVLEAAAYSKLIQVHSKPVAPDTWAKDNGKHIEEQVESLFRKAITIALNDFSQPPNDTRSHSTIRYLDNGKKQIERGQIIHQDCSETLFRSLQEELKLVTKASFQQCNG